MKLIISGASGLVGTALTGFFRSQGHTVLGLSRSKDGSSADAISWDPDSARVDVAALENADVVIHLSGADISRGRWTQKRREVLRHTRIDSTHVLVDAFAHLARPPRVFLSASAIGYYGNRHDEFLTEAAEPGVGFLSLLTRDWENEAMRAALLGIRTVVMRFGVILAPDGGALPEMARPFRWGLGGRLGGGRQWLSWIALDDVARIVQFVVENSEINGAVNVVAPDPVRNCEFAKILARTVHRPAVFSVPEFALRLALGEMADALLLSSQRVLPEKLHIAGYRFCFDDLESLLRVIFSARGRR